MMTDKATVEMESPVTGIVSKVAGEAGDVIPIGSMLIEITTEGDVEAEVEAGAPPEKSDVTTSEPKATEPASDVTASSPAKPQPEPVAEVEVPTDTGGGVSTSKVTASPAVRARAKALGVDLGHVKTQGNHVRHADLDAYLSYGKGRAIALPVRLLRAKDEAIKVIGMRRRIAENMAASKRNIPHFTYVEELDVTALEAMRADLNKDRGDRPKLTMLPFLIVAICKIIPDFPMINALYDDEERGIVTRHGAIHLGMATQTDAGLMVPVIRDAQELNVWQLAHEIGRLAEAARNGDAKSDELSGSTLTVTSLGPLGGIATTPVINRPEVAIIGPNKIIERPMFVGDAIEARKFDESLDQLRSPCCRWL